MADCCPPHLLLPLWSGIRPFLIHRYWKISVVVSALPIPPIRSAAHGEGNAYFILSVPRALAYLVECFHGLSPPPAPRSLRILCDSTPPYRYVAVRLGGYLCIIEHKRVNYKHLAAPPYEPDILRRVTDLSSSCHSKNLFSVYVFINQYQWHIAPPCSHP